MAKARAAEFWTLNMVDPRQHPVACHMRLGGLTGSILEVMAVTDLLFVGKNRLCWIFRGALGALVSRRGICNSNRR